MSPETERLTIGTTDLTFVLKTPDLTLGGSVGFWAMEFMAPESEEAVLNTKMKL